MYKAPDAGHDTENMARAGERRQKIKEKNSRRTFALFFRR